MSDFSFVPLRPFFCAALANDIFAAKDEKINFHCEKTIMCESTVNLFIHFLCHTEIVSCIKVT